MSGAGDAGFEPDVGQNVFLVTGRVLRCVPMAFLGNRGDDGVLLGQGLGSDRAGFDGNSFADGNLRHESIRRLVSMQGELDLWALYPEGGFVMLAMSSFRGAVMGPTLLST